MSGKGILLFPSEFKEEFLNIGIVNAGAQGFRQFCRAARGRPDQTEIRRDALLENFMDIGRDIAVSPAVIAALEMRHAILKNFQQLVHLNRVQLPDLIDKKNAAVRLANRTRSGLGDAHLPERLRPP